MSFREEDAVAALANLEEAIAALRAAAHARTEQGSWTLMARAERQAINAREKLREALASDEAAE